MPAASAPMPVAIEPASIIRNEHLQPGSTPISDRLEGLCRGCAAIPGVQEVWYERLSGDRWRITVVIPGRDIAITDRIYGVRMEMVLAGLTDDVSLFVDWQHSPGEDEMRQRGAVKHSAV